MTSKALTKAATIADIRQLAAEGKTYAEIGVALELSYYKIYTLAQENGIEVSRRSKVERAVDDIRRLASQGCNQTRIAAELGLSLPSVATALKRYDIAIVKQPKPPKEERGRKKRLSEIKRMYEGGLSSVEISRALSISRETLLKDFRALGISVKTENERKKEDQARQVRELAHQGYLSGEIAEQMGISADMVRIIARKNKINIPLVKPIEHGTLSAYGSRGCRCDQCIAVNSDRVREYKESLKTREMPDELHGTDTGYRNWGCRCKPCKHAGSLTNKKASSLDAPSERQSARWTPDEDLMVADRSMTARELALKLGRTIPAVNARRAILSTRTSKVGSSAS